MVRRSPSPAPTSSSSPLECPARSVSALSHAPELKLTTSSLQPGMTRDDLFNVRFAACWWG